MATANNINKRNQFQLQLLTQKINENKLKLNQLTTSRYNLLHIVQNNPNPEEQEPILDEQLSTLESTLQDVTEISMLEVLHLEEEAPLLEVPKDETPQEKRLRELLEEKQLLENQSLEIKSNIAKCRSNHANTTNLIKLLPSKLAVGQQQEKDIYQEEIQNIQNKINEAEELHLAYLIQLEDEKNYLANDINEYQNRIISSNANITSIQEGAHGFRKNTIQQLQQRKQQKVEMQNMLDAHYQQCAIYTNTKNNIQDEINNLTTIKSNAINIFYSSDTSNLQSILDNLNLQLPNTTTTLTTTEILNAIVAFIDNKVSINNAILANLSNKSQKLEKRLAIINNSNHNPNTNPNTNPNSNSNTNTSNNQTNNNSSTNIGVVGIPKVRANHPSYKQEFKTAKLERDELQKTLDALIIKYSNWDIEMVNTARINYQNLLDELEHDKQRAAERLEVMTTRLGVESENEMVNLKGKLKVIETNLVDASNKLQNNKKALNKVEQDIQVENAAQTEVNKLNGQIATLEDIIKKIQLDIDSLSNRSC
jgi:hypothetical protein